MVLPLARFQQPTRTRKVVPEYPFRYDFDLFGSCSCTQANAPKLVDVSPHDLRHRFGYRMAESVPLHRLAQIMGHDSLDTTKLYIQGTKHDLHQAVETIAWT